MTCANCGAENRARRKFCSECGTHFVAPVLAGYGRWLVATGRGVEAAPLLDEARGLFERMGATAWLNRLTAIAHGAPVPAGVAG